LQHIGAFRLLAESALDRIDLAADLPDPQQEFFLVFGGVSHRVAVYYSGV